MGVTSVNLSVTPFISSCDSTRLNMAAKQFSQSLTHPNCEIPYIVNNEWRALSESSKFGVQFAKESGEVLLNKDDSLFVSYKSGGFDLFNVPPIKKTTSVYASTLRSSLKTGTKFNAGDIIYEYDAFHHGIPSSGYNTTMMYVPFFGSNHEDSLVISEDFAERARHKYVETVYIPITEYTLFQKQYNNHLKFFPDIGEEINGDVICTYLLPQSIRDKHDFDNRTVRAQVVSVLQSMNVSDIINLKVHNGNDFTREKVITHVENGIVSGFKIHRLKKDVKLIDTELQNVIDKLYKIYNVQILDLYNDLTRIGTDTFARKVLRENYIYADREKIRKGIDMTDAIYVLELEVQRETHAKLGDKMSTRHASKGVVSLILPSELRPYIKSTGERIDFIYSPFGVFSRMNLSQVLELTCAKPTHYIDKAIREDPLHAGSHLRKLNEKVIKYLGDEKYYNMITKYCDLIDKDPLVRKEFVNSVKSTNLYVEVPSFTKIDIRGLLNNTPYKANEDVVLPKKTINYLKEKMGCLKDFNITSDITMPNVFCGAMYVQKLHKISEKLITYRDLGPLKYGTMQPERGKAAHGGGTLGQMEIEAIIASGCETALTELITVKNDWTAEKKNFLYSVISSGTYELPDEIPNDSSQTKTMVNSLLTFLKK